MNTGDPTEVLKAYISDELEHVREGMPTRGVDPKDFYRGAANFWQAIKDELDIERRTTNEIIIDAILETPELLQSKVYLLKGYAGSGKSIAMRRAAWESAVINGKFTFWLKEGGICRPDSIVELCQNTDERVYIFIEEAVAQIDNVEALIRQAKSNKISLTIILAARTNEWNVAGDKISRSIDDNFELHGLSDREIDQLIDRLRSKKCMGALEGLSIEDQKSLFRLTSDRQLLVALHEATAGTPFEDIVMDECRNIFPPEAQSLYLDVCTLHRFGVGMRSGLVSRVSNITFNDFETRLHRPLEHLVQVYMDAQSRDHAYQTRHRIVADIVFRGFYEDPQNRSDQIVRIVESMNTDYESDEKAFAQLLRGRDLAELFLDRSLADRIFDAASRSGANLSHIEHQRAVFELGHPDGDVDYAERAIVVAERECRPQNLDSIRHTKARILVAKAKKVRGTLACNKFLGDAEEILERLVRKKRSPHAFVTLGRIYLDRIAQADVNTVSQGGETTSERALTDATKDLERRLAEGTALFPGDSHLGSLEADFAQALNDSPRAFDALRATHTKNPQDEFVAARLARMLENQSEYSAAVGVLRKCIENNPSARRAKTQLAKHLIELNDPQSYPEIKRLLRSSFSDGDTNREARFWYARHEYLYGNRDIGAQHFHELSVSPVRAVSRIDRASVVLDATGNKKRFTGTIKTIREGFCFVRVPELNNEVYIHHSDIDGRTLDELSVGERVSLLIMFSFRGPCGKALHVGHDYS